MESHKAKAYDSATPCNSHFLKVDSTKTREYNTFGDPQNYQS